VASDPNLVFLRGNDPRSLAYQANALPLSYRNLNCQRAIKNPPRIFPGGFPNELVYLHKRLVPGTLPGHIFLKFANKVSHFSPLFCLNLDELFAIRAIVAVIIHLVYL